MLRPRDRKRASTLNASLLEFSSSDRQLLGIQTDAARGVLVAQLLESVRRVEYVKSITAKPATIASTNPHSSGFNPLRAAWYHQSQGNSDEACWLIFLATHFGKHAVDGWQLLQAVYGKLGDNPYWTWKKVSSDVPSFRAWLSLNQNSLNGLRFGNHRKYESLRAESEKGLAKVVESYVEWIGPPQTHEQKFKSVTRGINDPTSAFDALYRDQSKLSRWGRLAKFDHLTMLAKLGIIHITPGTTYLRGATGPRRGAALLLTGSPTGQIDIDTAEAILIRLGEALSVGQQELEDSLCNWQKSPENFIPFR